MLSHCCTQSTEVSAKYTLPWLEGMPRLFCFGESKIVFSSKSSVRFGFHRISPRELLSPFLGKTVSVDGIVTKCTESWRNNLNITNDHVYTLFVRFVCSSKGCRDDPFLRGHRVCSSIFYDFSRAKLSSSCRKFVLREYRDVASSKGMPTSSAYPTRLFETKHESTWNVVAFSLSHFC